MKMVAGTIFVIGIFSLGFLFVQNQVMEASLHNEEISHLLESIQLPADTVLISEEFEMPNIELVNLAREVDEAWLPAEEVAKLSAFYIWEILGTSIENLQVELIIEAFAGGRPWWKATVRDEEGAALYWVIIDAFNGDRLRLVNEEYEIVLRTLHAEDESRSIFSLLPELKEEEVADFYELARQLAGRHFHNTKVVEVELISDCGFRWNQNNVVVDQELGFRAVDAIGRVVQMRLSRELGTVIELRTWEQEFFPGRGFDLEAVQMSEGSFSMGNVVEPLALGETLKEALLNVSQAWPHVLTLNNTLDDILILGKQEIGDGVFVFYQESEEGISQAFVKEESGHFKVYFYSVRLDVIEAFESETFLRPHWMLGEFGRYESGVIRLPFVAFGFFDREDVDRVTYAVTGRDEIMEAHLLKGDGFGIWMIEVEGFDQSELQQLSAYSTTGNLISRIKITFDGFHLVNYSEQGEIILEVKEIVEERVDGIWVLTYRNGELVAEEQADWL